MVDMVYGLVGCVWWSWGWYIVMIRMREVKRWWFVWFISNIRRGEGSLFLMFYGSVKDENGGMNLGGGVERKGESVIM